MHCQTNPRASSPAIGAASDGPPTSRHRRAFSESLPHSDHRRFAEHGGALVWQITRGAHGHVEHSLV